MILLTHQRPSQGDAALPARWIEHTLDRECCNVSADAAGGIGARLALRTAEKMGGPKKGECRPLHLIPPHIGGRNGSKAGAMDRNGGDPVHEISIISIAELSWPAVQRNPRIGRTRAFGARVGRRVGGSRMYVEQIAAVRARSQGR